MNPEGRFIVHLTNLAAKEFVGFEMLGMQELPVLVQARCDQAVAQRMEMIPQQVHPHWRLLLVAYLMLAGFAATVYVVLSLLQLLI